jgi:hypothetical protein
VAGSLASGIAYAATTTQATPITVTMTDSSGAVLGQATVNVSLPVVTVTETTSLAPTPTPTLTPMAAPTATPTPTVSLTPTLTPTPLLSGTTSGAVVLNGVHDVTYTNVTFDGAGTGGADSSGVIYIGGGSYNISFIDCTINSNRDGVGDGVKIVGGDVHDITFDGCHFLTQPRMGFEAIGRSGSGYQRVNVINSTFEVQGSEAVSYDDDTGLAGNSTFSGNLVKGGGATTLYPWGQGFELNDVANMTVTANTFYRSRGAIWNLQMARSTPSGWAFQNNVVDATEGTISASADANPVCAQGIYGGVFSGNVITNQSAWAVACLSNDHDMDWRTTTWSDARGLSFSTPYQTSCSDNVF